MINYCNIGIVPHFLQTQNIQSQLWSVISSLSISHSNFLEMPIADPSVKCKGFSNGQKKLRTFCVILLLIPLTLATISASTSKLLFKQSVHWVSLNGIFSNTKLSFQASVHSALT